MKNRIELRSWLMLSMLGILAGALFLLSATIALPGGIHTLVQSVAEALTVSIVVALVVEPCLLRHFGEELASQTFWASFYSRAPKAYREAIQELASAAQFAVAVNIKLRLDWEGDDQAIIRFRRISPPKESQKQRYPCALPRCFQTSFIATIFYLATHGLITDYGQEPWKAPLPQFIEHLYLERFGREQPRVVTPAENWGWSAAGNPARDALAANARSDQAAQGSP